MADSSSGKAIMDEYANLSINDDDEEGLILPEIPENNQVINYSLWLVGCFLNQKKTNFGAMRDTLSTIWRPVKGVFMEETNTPNVYLFRFFHKLDVQRVMEDGPWTFNQQVLLVKRLEEMDQLASIHLSELYIWVQVYDLPIGFNSDYILKSIGDYVGNFKASDSKNFQSFSRSYLRIQVAIDVHKPLKSKMCIKKKGGEWLWIHFKYERLPSFCFFCGIIGHSEKFCELLFDNPDKGEEKKFDSTLRAPVRKQQCSGSSNQWLRGEDGGKLNMATPDNLERSREGEGSSKMQLNQGRDLRKFQQEVTLRRSDNPGTISELVTINQKLAVIKQGNISNEPENLSEDENSVLEVSESKKRRMGLDIGLQEETEVNGDVIMGTQDGLITGQKNLLLAGSAMQARHSS